MTTVPCIIDESSSGLWVKPTGDIDLANRDAFFDMLHAARLVAGERELILDASAISFIDSSGLSALAQVMRQMPEPTRMRIHGARPTFLRILQITSLQTLLTICSLDCDH